MLCKLAWGNVRRAGRDYLVYLLTLTLGVAVFYAFNTVSMQADLAGIPMEGLSELLGEALGGLTYFLAAIMGFLMVYANNFIMKRRKKEFGLYQVLGMTRGRVALIMALETAIVSGAALVLGLLLGVGVSWVMTFFTASMFKAQISTFHFFFSLDALRLTVSCLVTIFVVTLAFNLRVVARTRLIGLMSASRQNEQVKMRKAWVSVALFAAGAALVGVAYARLLHDGFPIDLVGDELDQGMTQFEITTGMVTAGTIMLFFGLSGALLALVQRLRAVYWRGLNMFTLRQLAAKVNTVSLSMGVISMILFLAITSVTCGMSVASVMSENLEINNPVDVSSTYTYNSAVVSGFFEKLGGDGFAFARGPLDIYDNLRGIKLDDGSYGMAEKSANKASAPEELDARQVLGDHVQIDQYYSIPANTMDAPEVSPSALSRQLGIETPAAFGYTNSETFGLYVASESQYNALLSLRGLPQVSLGEDGYLITCDMGETASDLYDHFMSEGQTLTIAGHELRPVASKVDAKAGALGNSAMGSNPGTVIVPDAVLADANYTLAFSTLLANYRQDVTTKQGDDFFDGLVLTTLGEQDGGDLPCGYWSQTIVRRSEMYEQSNSMRGVISYLAIYIGFVLVVACAAILTIQQLSGVADSTRSYRVLSELGCETSEIRHSVLAQQAVFFVFPLVVGVAHSSVALHVIIDLVKVMGNISIGGTVGLTCAVFLAAYGGYFVLTYVMGTGIVRDAIRVRKSE